MVYGKRSRDSVHTHTHARVRAHTHARTHARTHRTKTILVPETEGQWTLSCRVSREGVRG